MKQCSDSLNDFKELQVQDTKVALKREQVSAFQDSTGQLSRKLKDLGSKIQEKAKVHADLAQPSITSSIVDTDKDTNQEDFMVAGISQDSKNTNKQGYQLTTQQIKFTGEVDFMHNVIQQRKQDINSIANIMADINEIAKDIAIETKAQGEKLERIDQNMAEADKNAEAALGELNQA